MLFPSEFTLTASGDGTAREWEVRAQVRAVAGVVPGFSPLHGTDANEPGRRIGDAQTGGLARAAGAFAQRSARKRECGHALPAHPPQIRPRVASRRGRACIEAITSNATI